MKRYHGYDLFAFIISFFIVNAVWSQRVTFRHIDPPEVNPWFIVTSITQDSQGYMWFAGNGLHRYDGMHVVTYRNDPVNPNSLMDNAVETLFADDDNGVWIGTQGAGMDCFNIITKTFTHYRHRDGNENSISTGTIAAITKDHEGNIWIGTGAGLDRLDPKTGQFIHYRHNEHDSTSLSSDIVRAVYVDSHDVLWVGTGSPFHDDNEINNKTGGLNRLDKKTNKFTRYLHKDNDPYSLVDNRVKAIYEDSHGTFWVGSAGDGLHSLDRVTGKFTRYTYDPVKISRSPIGKGFPWVDDHITFIREDAAGSLWIGTMMGGITQYDPTTGRMNRYSSGKDSANGFSDNSAWTALSSNDGTFWISTWQTGIYRVNPFEQTFPYYNIGEHVHGIYKEANGDAWICTHTGLAKINATKKIIKKYLINMANRGDYDNINSFLRDRSGIFWIATGQGLISFDPLTEKTQTYTHDEADRNSLSHNVVFSIIEDHNRDLWLGTLDGLNKMDRKSGKFIHYKDESKKDNTQDRKIIIAVLEDRDYHLWMANFDGIHLVDPNTGIIKNYLKGTAIFSIFQDTDGALWAGSSEGLFRYRSGTDSFEAFLNPASGTGFKNVRMIFEDAQKRLWISSSLVGITRFNQQRDSSNTFEAGFGIKELKYIGRQLNSPDKRLFFSDATGFYDILPGNVSGNFIPPSVAFTDFRLGEQSLFTVKNTILPGGLPPGKTIYLNYQQNVFSFDFDVLHFTNPQNNRCLYKLENYDNKWREPGAERSASYFNVPPGHYLFRVKAANSNGIWSEKNIDIIISPPWWKTWWAYSVFGIAFLATIWAFMAYRSRKLRSENRILEEKVTQRTNQLKQSLENLKSTQGQLIQSEKMASLGELTAGIAHEIQNPLNFVNNFSEINSELIGEMKEELSRGNIDEAKTIAEDINENEQKIIFHGKRADAIVKSMLQHSRSSTGIKEPTNINALADECLRLSYHGMRAKDKSFNATLKTDYDETIGNINIIPQDIGRVILNVITNAFFAVNEKKLSVVPIATGTPTTVKYEPTVLISTKKINNSVEIKVADNGNGIPSTVLDKIFQPFFSTKPTGQGTGLGLSLSYDIVKAHGGELTVETRENEGSTFIIQLPNQSPI
jgi:signal transduction histidine kinase/ligand-binding sensor domain-containing protein